MNHWLKNSFLVSIYLFFYVPIIVLIIYSFNQSSFSLLWQGATLKWYYQLLDNTGVWRATQHSLVLGVCTAIIATSLGTSAAISLYRYRFLGRQLLHGLTVTLILVPDIIMGVALLMLYKTVHLTLGFWSLLLSHITFCIPFVVITLYARLRLLDKHLIEAAKDLGANDLVILQKILLPLLSPAIFASLLLCFTLSFDDIIISYFVSGPSFDILPLHIYSMVKVGIKPEINALCTLVLLAVFSIVITAHSLLRKKL